MNLAAIPAPREIWFVRPGGRPERGWLVDSHYGITALAMPVHPINEEAAPDAPGTAPDPQKEIQP